MNQNTGHLSSPSSQVCTVSLSGRQQTSLSMNSWPGTITDESALLRQVVFHDVAALTERLFPIVEAMQKHFSAGTGAYYSDSIFFLSVAMHRIMPAGEGESLCFSCE